MAAYQTTGLNNFTELTPDEWARIVLKDKYTPELAQSLISGTSTTDLPTSGLQGLGGSDAFRLTRFGRSPFVSADVAGYDPLNPPKDQFGFGTGVFYDPTDQNYYVTGAANNRLWGHYYRYNTPGQGGLSALNNIFDKDNGSIITGLTARSEDPTTVYIGTTAGGKNLFNNGVTTGLFSNPVSEAVLQKPTEYLNRGLSGVVDNTLGNGWLGTRTRGAQNNMELFGPSMTASNDDSGRRRELTTSDDTVNFAGTLPIAAAAGSASRNPIGYAIAGGAIANAGLLADAAKADETAAPLTLNDDNLLGNPLSNYYSRVQDAAVDASGPALAGSLLTMGLDKAASTASAASSLPAWANSTNAMRAYNAYTQAKNGDPHALLTLAAMYGGDVGKAAQYITTAEGMYNAAASGDTVGLIGQLATASGIPPAYVNAAVLAGRGKATPQQVLAAAKAMYNSGSTTGLAGNVLNRYLFSESSNA